jgi:predicted ATPase
MELSGLEDEFELSGALPRLLYVKEPAPDREPRLTDLLARIAQKAAYRGFRTPAELGRLVREDLATLLSERFADARPEVSAPRRPSTLPVATTSLVGREQAVDEVAGLVERRDARLVTLTGPGGIGKTRLAVAVAVAERVRDRFDQGTVLVSLATVTQPALVLAAVGRAVGAEPARTDSPLQALVERFGDGRWLLILDNLEQVLDVAPDLAELLARCPGVVIMATSRTVLRLRAEREYHVPPLPAPPDPATVSLEDLLAAPAVALFVDRATAARHDFALTGANAPAVVEICRRLEGLPLAIELAAARSRMLGPKALLRRPERSLAALGTGTVDMPERQQTLRATVEWSVGMLGDAELSVLETLTVFVDGWTLEAAADVAGLDEDRTFDLTDDLAGHSLIYLDVGDHGPRGRMLDTIREVLADRLAARPDVEEIRRRHADHYRRLADRRIAPSGAEARAHWADRLQAEAGNLAAAVRWYIAHDRGPLPHLFRVLTLPWTLRDPTGEARSLVGELLPHVGSLEPAARAELLWATAVTALERGDDATALAAREGLEPLLDGIDDPYLRGVSELAMAWAAPIAGDAEGALRMAATAVAQLRGQDEPFWTAAAVAAVGSLERATGRYDDAERHLSELRDVAERLDSTWLSALQEVERGMLATMQGRFDDAWGVLRRALTTSLAAYSTPMVTFCLGAFARLAFGEGEHRRAAVLAGAAAGLRERAGVRAWPMLRRPEAELIAQIKEALGPDFDSLFRRRLETLPAGRGGGGPRSPSQSTIFQ